MSTTSMTGTSGPQSAVVPTDKLRYMARQPILDARGKVHGYELLFRAGPGAGFSGDGEVATRTMLDNTVLYGLEKLTAGLPAFVNCTAEALIGRTVEVLPPHHTVLEVLETVAPTLELLEACLKLKRKGYRIALDDFIWGAEWEPFLELADYVKVDISVVGPKDRAALLARMRGMPARMLAERVETQAEFEQTRLEGFTLFQGFYFCRPVLIKNREIPTNRMIHLELLRALLQDPLDHLALAELVKRDPSLTYRLLRLVNSPMFGMRNEIRSIQSALGLVGDGLFRRMATVAIASELNGGEPSELLRMTFQRGRFCELAAGRVGLNATEQYLLGILSLLPALLRAPMDSLAGFMPLREAALEALLGAHNLERRTLDWIEYYEQGNWEICDKASERMGLAETVLPELYAEAVLWAEANLDRESV